MKKLEEIKAWAKWKGITFKDVAMITVALGFLVSVTVIYIWAGVQALL